MAAASLKASGYNFMRERAQVRLLPDGRRLHLHDGPIDIVLEAFGKPSDVQSAYRAAAQRIMSVLDELCDELPNLRRAPGEDETGLTGVIARRMLAAVMPYASDTFITPMAAVAGAVAEEILLAMTRAATLERAYINDGGDIALHLSPGQKFVVGMVDLPDRPSLFGSETGRSLARFVQEWAETTVRSGFARLVLLDGVRHLDPALARVVNGAMLPLVQGKIGREFAVCPSQKVQVELSSHTRAVIIGALEYFPIFLKIDPDQ